MLSEQSLWTLVYVEDDNMDEGLKLKVKGEEEITPSMMQKKEQLADGWLGESLFTPLFNKVHEEKWHYYNLNA